MSLKSRRLYKEYLEKSASLESYKEAQTDLGYEYIYGDTIPSNVSKGIHLLKLAAQQDDEYAEFYLGMLYISETQGVKTDVEEALKWLQSAASKENAAALYQLGIMNLEGEYISVNRKQGMELLEKSAELGNDLAKEKMAEIYNLHSTSLN